MISSQRVEHQDQTNSGSSERKGHGGRYTGTIGEDLFESTIDTSGGGECGRGTLNGLRYYSGNWHLVYSKDWEMVRSTATWGLRTVFTGVTWALA